MVRKEMNRKFSQQCKTMKPFYRFDEKFGHYFGPTEAGQYKMCKAWIDTDNQVWSEPYHLYGIEKDVRDGPFERINNDK
jgi:hypothetical protein